MAENQSLKRALRAMAAGSRSGFKTFYNGTAAFIYSSARLLYPSHEEACRFMVDIYQYIYLHLPEYDETQSIEKWISRMIYDRYTQLSIGREPLTPSVSRQMEAGSVVLSESERARIWRMLDVHIHFPPEQKKRRPPLPRILLILSVLALFLLLLIRYVPALLPQVLPQDQADGSPAAADAKDADTESGETDVASGSAVQSDALPQTPDDTSVDTPTGNSDTVSDEQAQMDELEERMNQIGAGNSSGKTDDTTIPDTPDTPDTSTPDISGTPDTSVSASRQNRTESGSSDSLEDLELELRYGDSLLFGNETD